MKKPVTPPRLPFALFMLVLLWSVFLCVKQINVMLPLYADAEMRTKVQHAITAALDERGLLASSVRIDALTPESVTLSVREYRKGFDKRTPLVIPLATK